MHTFSCTIVDITCYLSLFLTNVQNTTEKKNHFGVNICAVTVK